MTTFLSPVRIATRLAVAFGVLFLMMAATIGVGAWQIHEAQQLDALTDALWQRSALIERWKGATSLNLARAMALAESGYAPALTASMDAPMKALSAAITSMQGEIERTLVTDQERALFADIGRQRKAYVGVRARVGEAFKAGDEALARELTATQMAPGAQTYLDSLERMQVHAVRERDALRQRAARQSAQALWLLLGIGLGALAAGVGVAIALTRSITRPLRDAMTAASRMAQGDLSQGLASGRGDEIGAFLGALDDMQTRLRGMVGHIRDSSRSIALASAEVAAGSADLSARTEQAASHLQRTASSMEQINGTVRLTAQAAVSARDLVGTAAGMAQRGGTVVQDIVVTMDDFMASARRIADITAQIDGIAFQTNILALNAAIESARAGEHGRGFAVVAGEVRILAQRSADAAHEIRRLSRESVEKAEAGTQRVGDAGRTMLDIVGSVQRINTIIGEISTAATQQAGGLAEIREAVCSLDGATQQNAALVEQSAAAAHSMKDQVDRLQQAVAVFR